MSANAPVSAPSSAPASAPAPSSGGSAQTPASTPSPSTPSTPYGRVPREATEQIFANLDSAGGEQAPEVQPGEVPIAKVPGSESTQAPTEQAAPQPAAVSPGEEQLNQSIREALKTVADPRLRKQLADGQFILRDLSRGGLPLPAVRQFIQDAPKYLEIAPTLDSLQTIADSARIANGLGSDYLQGSPEGYQNFAGALVQANPESFVGLVDFVLGNSTEIVKALQTNLGTEVATQYRGAIDRFCDGIFSNVAQAMRRKAEEGGDYEVLSEVADEVEKFLGLDKAKQAAQAPARPDPRDERIRALESEKQQQVTQARERFASGVYNAAGSHLDQRIAEFVNSKGNLTTNQKTALDKHIGDSLYDLLLHNEAIQQKHQAIERSGRWDKAHFDQLTQLYRTAGERLLPQVAANVYRQFWALVGPEVQNRQAKVQAQVQRRDVGASGAPSVPRPNVPQIPAGTRGEKAWKQLFAGIDASAEQG